MKARIKWGQDRTFLGESGSGHTIVMGGDPDDGVRDLGIRPMKTQLMGFDGYTAYDVVDILERDSATGKQWRIASSRSTRRAPTIFRRFSPRSPLNMWCTAKNLNPNKEERRRTSERSLERARKFFLYGYRRNRRISSCRNKTNHLRNCICNLCRDLGNSGKHWCQKFNR